MKKAVILLNLGGPDTLAHVRPFLFNLFKDKAIINLPFFLRYPLAALISSRREKEAQHIYEQIGGASPLLKNTHDQARALQESLNKEGETYRCFTLMRYWHPMAAEVVAAVKDYAPDEIILLPLYPQFSTTTTQSAFDDFEKEWQKQKGGAVRVKKICCYPTNKGLIDAQANLIKEQYLKVLNACTAKGIATAPRILFSAHGLPEKVVAGGDPYQSQCVATTSAVVAALKEQLQLPALDFLNTYQSRVGPLKWIEPYTDVEIEKAGAEGRPLLIVPIAFVSEHSETLYEIEQQYRALATEKGVPVFARVPAVGTHPAFIAGLAALVKEAESRSQTTAPEGGKRLCSQGFSKCACRAQAGN